MPHNKIGQKIDSPCEEGKCTSILDEIAGSPHKICKKHLSMPHTPKNKCTCAYSADCPLHASKTYAKDYSHSHCWDQTHPPACGLKGKHKICCLCGNHAPHTSYEIKMKALKKHLPGLRELAEESAPHTEGWEARFDEEFNIFKDITITPRQAGDIKTAEIVQKVYRNTGERLKSFIHTLLSSHEGGVRVELIEKLPPEKPVFTTSSITNAANHSWNDCRAEMIKRLSTPPVEGGEGNK